MYKHIRQVFVISCLFKAIISMWKGPGVSTIVFSLPSLWQSDTSCSSYCTGFRWAASRTASQWEEIVLSLFLKCEAMSFASFLTSSNKNKHTGLFEMSKEFIWFIDPMLALHFSKFEWSYTINVHIRVSIMFILCMFINFNFKNAVLQVYKYITLT